MSLVDYRRKREFSKTREPAPGRAAAHGKRAIFVVQLHHASRRHYDFRLQVGNVLKSWAVPKGPSYDPAVKRMAVEVEDHPLAYAGFEGEIPKGQYGGGHVARFDQGYWSTEGDAEAQLAKGHLRFELFGDKLKGGWHLVRSGKPGRQVQWLLFKDRDGHAGTLEADDLLGDVTKAPAEDVKRAGAGKPAKARKTSAPPAKARRKRDWSKRALQLPGAKKARFRGGFFAPQLARLGDAPPQGPEWLHELKWDGYRLLVAVVDGKARLYSRNALDWTPKLPEIVAAVEALKLDSAALDGELIAGRGTKDDFNLLQATLAGEKNASLSLVLFDLLHLDGVDVSAAPLAARKALLEAVLGTPPPHLAYSSHIAGEGERAWQLAREQGFEGIVSKRADRAHHTGRSPEWRKTKHVLADEFAVVGYTAPKGSRVGIGALLLAAPEGRGWRYVGRMGSGFGDALLLQLAKRLGEGRREPTARVDVPDPELRRARWVAPEIVVEAFYRGIGGNGLLRQASLKAVRSDKSASDLRDSDRAPARAASEGRAMNATEAADDIAITHPERVVFPEDGIRKQDIADYYRAMARWLLPEIAGRPLSIVRCPQGAGRPCFFQKHHGAGMRHVDSVRLREESGEQEDYLVVRDEAALMELVQFNALEFHPWGAKADAPELADRLVFDLDPGPDVPWKEVVAAARTVRARLAELHLESWLRTSGGKGLHVVVPLRPACPWEQAKAFAHGFADALAASEPLKFLATASKRLRKGRIFVDYLRNGRGATSVASFSLRARPGAPVAMPLRWEELGRLKSAAQFTLRNAPARMRRLRAHPWEGIDKVKQDLSWLDARS
ncbi:DNA ligase D [Thermomonas brevis]|uniref:DNA ligase (ATP) n=1 Tax=Thermomonas brevis TaxID=215691 RepID=A0A7G9QS71_9GAMM|nr:DNA ligase D [Thermomonas brevis]QNN46196.1 DNA ligase D [Thermomonas brevis]